MRFVLIFPIVVCALVFGDIEARAWNCYDPQPGHPTAEEKALFIKEISIHALAAEQQNGIPAAALTAMAVLESGYGWTRTALNANNLFGWKFYSSTAAGGRPAWTLECQPPEDVNNRYVVFADRKDAVSFVAQKLATLGYYSQDRKRYLDDRKNGVETKVAVDRWVQGISDPYNWKPAKYTTDVVRLMNDPVSPSDSVSAERNLYKLSQAGPAAGPAGAGDADLMTHATQRYTTLLTAGRYMEQNCKAPNLAFPEYAGLPVIECSYASLHTSATVYMLNPDAAKLAAWTLNACRDAQVSMVKKCIDRTSTHIFGQSGAQFPVSGFVIEKAADAGGVGNGPYCLLFRDGVTVATASFDSQAPSGGKCGPDSANQEALTAVKRYGRIASTTREQYRAAGGTVDVGASSPASKRKIIWHEVVRDLYKQAWAADRNMLIYAWVLDAKKSGALQ